jgi:hypothetical protein
MKTRANISRSRAAWFDRCQHLDLETGRRSFFSRVQSTLVRCSLFFRGQEFFVDFGYYYVIWIHHFCYVDCGYLR